MFASRLTDDQLPSPSFLSFDALHLLATKETKFLRNTFSKVSRSSRNRGIYSDLDCMKSIELCEIVVPWMV